jgi:hypothetical protein
MPNWLASQANFSSGAPAWFFASVAGVAVFVAYVNWRRR